MVWCACPAAPPPAGLAGCSAAAPVSLQGLLELHAAAPPALCRQLLMVSWQTMVLWMPELVLCATGMAPWVQLLCVEGRELGVAWAVRPAAFVAEAAEA